jgi:phenylacetate-CoA ligase
MTMSVLESFYNNSPIWLQNVMVSARGLDYRYRRANSRINREQFEFLLRSQWWDEESFQKFQILELQKILNTAFKTTVHFHKMQTELQCFPEDFKSLNDLKRLPLLEKQDLRNNESKFYNYSQNLKYYNHIFTSGTTGTPINILESQESFSKRIAFVSRLRSWAGLDDVIFPRRAQFTGRVIVPAIQDKRKHIYWRINRPGNACLFSTTHLSAETVPHYIKALVEFRPDLIDGYPSALLIIARIAKILKLDLPVPKAIIVTAETLLPEEKEDLQNSFKCKVYNQYAASEPSCFWSECEYGVMHINPEYGISEILNPGGNPSDVGEEGEVVVTSFLNPVMPLIRYRIGDVAVVGSSSYCKCGRKMPRIQRVIGRSDDLLYIPERGYIGRLDPSFKGLSNIIEAQIIQESFSKIQVFLVPDENYSDEIGNKLVRNLKDKLGEHILINIIIVKRIDRGANGKFRTVISKVKHLYPDKL